MPIFSKGELNMKNILDFIYPQTCFWCGKITKLNPCKKCEIELNKIINFNIEYKEGFKHIYLSKYIGKMRKKILDFKFNEKPYLKTGFVNLFIKNKKMCLLLSKYDIIMEVPIHKKREKQRGYNQSQIIAKEIAKNMLNIEYENNVLIKLKNTLSQSTLDSKMRRQNVVGVYGVQNTEKIENKKIILFDDIYTTGSTAKECINVLKNNGAKCVDILTIAKD